MNNSNYFDVLNSILDRFPTIKGLFILDRNANLIAHVIGKEGILGIVKINKMSISAVVANLSGQKQDERYLFVTGERI